MANEISKIRKIRSTLDELESYLSEEGGDEVEEVAKDMISGMAEKGKMAIDKAEKMAGSLAEKVKGMKKKYSEMDEGKRDMILIGIAATTLALIIACKLKKMKEKR